MPFKVPPCSRLRDDRLSVHGVDINTKKIGDSTTGLMRYITQERDAGTLLA